MSDSPTTRLENDVRSALKAGEKERVSTLRMLLTDVKNEALRAPVAIDEAAFIGLVRKAIKQRQEAAALFRSGAREELAAKEDREVAMLEAYLPRQATEADITAAAQEALAAARAQGLTGKATMGPAMKALKDRFGATADAAVLSRILRSLLGD